VLYAEVEVDKPHALRFAESVSITLAGAEPSHESRSAQSPMNDQQRLELEAAAFRRLVAHLDSRKDVQNIDLMNLRVLPQLPVQVVQGRGRRTPDRGQPR
jgi:hypothetical protein